MSNQFSHTVPCLFSVVLIRRFRLVERTIQMNCIRLSLAFVGSVILLSPFVISISWLWLLSVSVRFPWLPKILFMRIPGVISFSIILIMPLLASSPWNYFSRFLRSNFTAWKHRLLSDLDRGSRLGSARRILLSRCLESTRCIGRHLRIGRVWFHVSRSTNITASQSDWWYLWAVRMERARIWTPLNLFVSSVFYVRWKRSIASRNWRLFLIVSLLPYRTC